MPGVNKYKRSWAYGSNAIISTVLFAGILAFIALIAERHPWRLDLTEAGKYTLSEQTRKILDSVKEPVRIKGFYASMGPEQNRAKETLENYNYYNKNITYEFVDPDRQPEVARRYEVRTYGTLVLEGYDKKEVVQIDNEEAITNAIFKLMRKEEKKIYFLTGHGEHSLKDFERSGYSGVQAALQKANYRVEEWNLMQQGKVPDDVSVLVVAGPRKSLMKEEVASLTEFVDGGGKLLILVEPFQDGGLRDFLGRYGMELHDDIVVDQQGGVYLGSYLMPISAQYGMQKITEDFQVASFFPEVRSVRAMEKPPENAHVSPLVFTSEGSWAETDLAALNQQSQAKFDESGDMKGPVPLAAIAEIGGKKPDSGEQKDTGEGDDKGKDAKKAYVVVYGDSDFASNSYFDALGNGDLFMNTVNFLAEEGTLINIKVREAKTKPMLMSQGQGVLVFWVSVVLVPLSVLMAGLAVYRVRRSQR